METINAPKQSRPAVIYARVSSKDQEREGFSIPAQLELLRTYAEANGFTVLQEFVDVETAKVTGRGGFGQMVSLLAKDKSCRTAGFGIRKTISAPELRGRNDHQGPLLRPACPRERRWAGVHSIMLLRHARRWQRYAH